MPSPASGLSVWIIDHQHSFSFNGYHWKLRLMRINSGVGARLKPVFSFQKPQIS